MPCPLSWDDNNWRSMFHTWMIYYHALTVVMRRWQLTEHVSNWRDKLPCSDRCHEMMTTDGAWFITLGMNNHALSVSRDDDNCRSMFHTWGIYHHALTFIMRRWQLTEHASYPRNVSPCSDRCQETLTTNGACFIDEWYITMLRPLS